MPGVRGSFAQRSSGGANEQEARIDAAPPSTCPGGVLFGDVKISMPRFGQ